MFGTRLEPVLDLGRPDVRHVVGLLVVASSFWFGVFEGGLESAKLEGWGDEFWVLGLGRPFWKDKRVGRNRVNVAAVSFRLVGGRCCCGGRVNRGSGG